jgi:outer membrane murein-binding lipoprotein Lpp
MTRPQILSVILYLVGGGYGLEEIHGKADNLKDRVAALEQEVNQTHTALAVIQAQGASAQRQLDEVRGDLKELTRALYLHPDLRNVGRGSPLPQ